ncbi:MAG: TonB-dependent receptor [Flavobacteriales bacterium]|nr:TonB-dependent receptor [Flavobacteriales bacterium]
MKKAFLAGIAVASFFSASAQSTLSGTITDEQGQPLPLVMVDLGDRSFGTTTDDSGAFSFGRVPLGSIHLRAALIGHQSIDTVFTMVGAKTVALRMITLTHYIREAEVTALRAGDRGPFATSTVTRERIEKINTAVDLPVLLEQQPSVVTTTDAGTGVGYTGLRIRGNDATRINVTVNGVPINDAESQAVFWVNMPDLASSAEDIEVQRGVGTSTNGPGAFGASINVRTSTLKPDAFGEVSAFGGSYNTQRYTARFGTGLLPLQGDKGQRFSLDGRLSTITSDGYIDRATSDLKSYFLQGAWVGTTRSLRFITFSGKEVTYQAWNGAPREVVDTNRTYNEYTYDQQVDDYKQSHYQLLFDQKIGMHGTLNATLFRVYGRGFFEQYKPDDDMATYGISPVVLDGDTLTSTDIIRRRWLDNVLTGANLSYETRLGAHRLVLGGSYSDYKGDHFGEVIWARYAGNTDIRDRYYSNDSRKTDGNAYAKLTYTLAPRIDLFGDAQVRNVTHSFLGYDGDLRNVTQEVQYTFFNPKAGVLFRVADGRKAYASVALANREPNRDDLTETSPESRPTSEHMTDLEVGYEHRTARVVASINGYYMDYTDQLVLTGELNDVGYALRTNVPSSYRAGVELMLNTRITQQLVWRANATFSRNAVRDYTEYLDDWDNGGQQAVKVGETELAFSPAVIAGSELGFRVWENAAKGNAELTLVTKYVGRQYLDNTASADRALDAYLVNDVRINVSFLGLKGLKRIDLNLTVRNLFSELYENNGWVYSYVYGGRRNDMVNVFAQAPLNVLVGATLRF